MLARAVTMCVALLVGLSGCVGTPPDRTAPARVAGVLTVFAPASLTEVFATLTAAFEQAHSGIDVRLMFGADSDMAARASSGFGADVLIVEGPQPLAALGAGAPVVFARNQLVLAIAPGNPKGLAGVADVARADIRVALCAQTEPCGSTSAAVLAAASVSLASPARAPDVRAALARVEQGTSDAALVYRTDSRVAADKVDTIEFAESRAALAEYQGVVLPSAPNRSGAEAFLDFLISAAAQDLLTSAGFQSPP